MVWEQAGPRGKGSTQKRSWYLANSHSTWVAGKEEKESTSSLTGSALAVIARDSLAASRPGWG